LVYKFFRHTDGARSVVSFLAVEYLDFHMVCLLVLLSTFCRSLPDNLAGAMPTCLLATHIQHTALYPHRARNYYFTKRKSMLY
jgi:hypothetical protein